MDPIQQQQQSFQEGPDSLFSQQPFSTEEVPWWKKNFLLQQPTLVNAWNAVFPTVIVQSGGIYFLVSHVLGKRIGGAIGIIYTFGQACATSLVALGFGESMAQLMGIDSPVATKTFSVVILLLLNVLNFAGLHFVIRLQLLLMCFLGMAIGDFLFGAFLFTPSDPEAGIYPLTAKQLSANWYSNYGSENCSDKATLALGAAEDHSQQHYEANNFFSVFGVLFANFIGVLAAEGELGALGFSFGLCFVFMLLLGASVDRNALQCDAMISEKLSLTKLVFLGGLYISCLSAILSSTLGTSRVVQGIANEGLFPQMSKLLIEESSPTRESHRATVLVTAFAIILLLLGDLNQIAILSSLPFLFTYATVNYAYVSLSMSDDLEGLNNECAAENDNKQQTSYGTVQDGAAIYSSHGQQRKSLDALFAQTTEGINSIRQENVQKAWYQHCINRYVSFGAAIIHILVATFVHRVSRFSIMHMIRVAMSTQDTPDLNSSQNSARLVAPPPSALFQPGNIQPPQALNAQNPDYAERKNYHHTEQLGAAKQQHP
uniref:Amino acid permease/ SLC12A domain-containing protein n=2 Tax=Meloidogyne javanica TaxID=6303 RepID=A0A915LFZ6_MELJA